MYFVQLRIAPAHSGKGGGKVYGLSATRSPASSETYLLSALAPHPLFALFHTTV